MKPAHLPNMLAACLLFSTAIAAPPIIHAEAAPNGLTHIDLLQMAMHSASAIPVDPHIKDRSRAQAEVVVQCLKQGEIERAIQYANEIENWQQGESYAFIAKALFESGEAEKANAFLSKAREWTGRTEDWRHDRLLFHINQALRLQNDNTETTDYAQQLDDIQQALKEGSLDSVKAGLMAATDLYNKFYDHKDRRESLSELILDSWDPLPVFIRFDLLLKLIEAAGNNKDPDSAITWCDKAALLIEAHRWPLEVELKMRAQLASARFLAGDEKRALINAQQAFKKYEDNYESIVNIWRAGALRPLAEAFVAMGELEAATNAYHKALDAGIQNPNSRPRAEDLSATCLSMVESGFTPDAEMSAQIEKINRELRAPW